MSQFALNVQSPKITVNGSGLVKLWADQLTTLSLEMQLQIPTRLTLRFEIPTLGSAPPAFPFALGDTIKVSFPKPEPSPTFEPVCGRLLVTEIGAEHGSFGKGELVVVAHDASYALAQSHKVATFVNMGVSEVAQKVAQEAGIAVGEVDATSGTEPYLMQADTDFGFISTLARRVGYDWWVDDEKLYFKKPKSESNTVVSIEDNVLRLSVSQQAVAAKKVEVNGWDRDEKKSIKASASVGSPDDTTLPGVSSAVNGVDKASPSHATSSIFAANDAEADSVAKSLAERYRSSSLEVQGEVVGDPGIKPRTTVEVSGGYFAGKYEVVDVEHRYGPEGYTTRFTGGDRVPSGLADLLAGGGLAEHFGSYTGLPALLPAVVTAIGTAENLGRVQVKFPYLSDDNTSHWARVLSAGGGPQRGFWFLPEVDDEVLVAFEAGDVRFPVVMGGLYGKVDKAGENDLIRSGQIHSRSVRSRLGHYMDFFDGEGPETRHIAMGLGSGGKPGSDYLLRLGEDRFDIEVPEGKPIAIKAGSAQITFTSDKSIEIAAQNITVKAESALKLEGQTVEIKGQMSVGIQGAQSKVDLANGGADIKGMPKVGIKGAPQVSIG